MFSASPLFHFHTKFTYQKYAIIKLTPPRAESSTKVSKFHPPTDSEPKFHKARIENWLPSELKLGLPWLGNRCHNHRLGTR